MVDQLEVAVLKEERLATGADRQAVALHHGVSSPVEGERAGLVDEGPADRSGAL